MEVPFIYLFFKSHAGEMSPVGTEVSREVEVHSSPMYHFETEIAPFQWQFPDRSGPRLPHVLSLLATVAQSSSVLVHETGWMPLESPTTNWPWDLISGQWSRGPAAFPEESRLLSFHVPKAL